MYAAAALLTFGLCQLSLRFLEDNWKYDLEAKHEKAIDALREQFNYQRKLYREIYADEVKWNQEYYESKLQKRRDEIHELIQREHGNVKAVRKDLEELEQRREQVRQEKEKAHGEYEQTHEHYEQLLKVADSHITALTEELQICMDDLNTLREEFNTLRYNVAYGSDTAAA